jgi:hypothetical protein
LKEIEMNMISKKTLVASVGALAIAASFAATATPAAAGWHGHHGFGGGLGVGLLGAAIVGGAIAASQPSYAYGGCELRRQPVYNRFGDVIGFRRVRVCF